MKKIFSGEKAANKYNSSSWTMCACLALCFVADFVVAVTLMASGINFGYAVVPFLSAILDAVFFAVALNSSFRFRYALVYYAIYVATYVVFFFITVAVNFYGAATAMVTWVAIVWAVLHAFAIVVSGIAYVYSAKSHKFGGLKSFIVMIVLLCLLFGAVVGYSVVFFQNGYFGQGFEGQVRPILFEVDQFGDG